MITANKYQTVVQSRKHQDYSFIPTLLCAMAGVGIGLAIGNCFGWL